MFIEMIDLLRCVNVHEDTWLVASLRAIENRLVLDGTLGCPVCSAQYRIKNGVADFSLGETLSAYADEGPTSRPADELATRAGAYLDATQAGATLVLGGSWAYAAQELAEMADLRVLALNPPSGVKESERVGLVRVADRIPLAPDSVHGIALDSTFPAGMVEEAFRVVNPGGRIVGPSSFEPPVQGVMLARDESHWIAAKPAQMVSLKRSPVQAPKL